MLKEVELEQSYEELLVLRKIAMRKVEKERSLAEVRGRGRAGQRAGKAVAGQKHNIFFGSRVSW